MRTFDGSLRTVIVESTARDDYVAIEHREGLRGVGQKRIAPSLHLLPRCGRIAREMAIAEDGRHLPEKNERSATSGLVYFTCPFPDDLEFRKKERLPLMKSEL